MADGESIDEREDEDDEAGEGGSPRARSPDASKDDEEQNGAGWSAALTAGQDVESPDEEDEEE